jgi:hypothetical protein
MKPETELTARERQFLKSLLKSARTPVWLHILVRGWPLCVFLAVGFIILRFPAIVEPRGFKMCHRLGTLWLPAPRILEALCNTAGGYLLITTLLVAGLMARQVIEHRRIHSILSRVAPDLVSSDREADRPKGG